MQVNTADAFTDDAKGTILFNLDPDGMGGSNTPITFILGHDGRLMTQGTVANFTSSAGAYTFTGSVATAGATDPTWFSWQ